jgi:threonyl-tRNA synthetase
MTIENKNMDKDNLNNLRHSAAHLLAAAVLEFYPDAKRTIGPSIENGFYYDFDFGDQVVTEADLEKIENKMRELLKKWVGMKRREVSAEEAKEFYQDNPYKLELIEQFATDGQIQTELKQKLFPQE